jgi:flagellar assembly protein FliH
LPGLPTAEDVERMHEEARAAGLQAGLAEGRAASGEQQAREAVLETGRQFNCPDRQPDHDLDSLDQTVADQLLALAIEIASQVTRGAISTKTRYFAARNSRGNFSALPLHQAHVVLRLNPADAASVRSEIGDSYPRPAPR